MFEDIDTLYAIMERRLEETSVEYHRPLYDQIDWDDRLVCIKGAKGTGKTTLMQQFLKEHPRELEHSLYVSLDNLWFSTHSPLEVADYLHTHKGKRLFIDEVHHFKDWQTLIKNLNDDYPRLKIVYSGSSMLRLDQDGGDLSRRQRVYELRGLSFREYLMFEGLGSFSALKLKDILSKHRTLARPIKDKVSVVSEFEKYVKSGYYPFYKSARGGYSERLAQVARQILELDWPQIEEVSLSTIKKTEKMLMVLASSCPQIPKMNELYAQLETDRNQGLRMMHILERAGLLELLHAKSVTLDNLSRPDKIYLDNPNLMYALSSHVDSGTMRECVFINQLRAAGHEVLYAAHGDFKVDGKYTFEVGGAKKGFGQIKDIPNSFVVQDGQELGLGNKIPLWLFGFLY